LVIASFGGGAHLGMALAIIGVITSLLCIGGFALAITKVPRLSSTG
jgi:hypothetical protein